MTDSYFSHSGIKGMKWGQRLYQYKDGSLTPLGRIRYRKKSVTITSGTKSSRRKLSDLSDDELRQKVDRIKLETEYLRAVSSYNELTSSAKQKRKKTQSWIGRKLDKTLDSFIDKGANKIVEKAFASAGTRAEDLNKEYDAATKAIYLKRQRRYAESNRDALYAPPDPNQNQGNNNKKKK